MTCPSTPHLFWASLSGMLLIGSLQEAGGWNPAPPGLRPSPEHETACVSVMQSGNAVEVARSHPTATSTADWQEASVPPSVPPSGGSQVCARQQKTIQFPVDVN